MTIPKTQYVVFTSITAGLMNGDPDNENRQREWQDTGFGFTTDAFMKRKIRNVVAAVHGKGDEVGFDTFIAKKAVLNDAIDAATSSSANPVAAMIEKYFDIRWFGAVLSTGSLKGSSDGQVQGPVQVGFGQTLHPITQTEVTITRCAVTTAADINKERTMGKKWVVPYAMFRQNVYLDNTRAEEVGFDTLDQQYLEESLVHLFHGDKSACRAEAQVVRVYKITHENFLGNISDAEAMKMVTPVQDDPCVAPSRNEDFIFPEEVDFAVGESKTFPAGFTISRLA